MQEEMQKDTALTFSVGLNEKEYILFQKTVSKFSVGRRFPQILGFAAVVFAVFTVLETVKSGIFFIGDPMVMLPLAMVILCAVLIIIAPKINDQRRFKRGYRDAVAGGQVFDGMITVNDEGVTKVTESGSVTLSFDRDLLCVERREMFIFVNRFGQGIVIPARCLTSEDANGVRLIAQKNIHPRFYLLKGRVEPLLTERMELVPAKAPKTLYTFTMQYDEKEHKALMQTIIKRDIFRSAPLAFALCFLFAVYIGLDTDFSSAALVFWITIVLFAGIKVLFWLPRYKRRKEQAVLTAVLTERAFVVEKRSSPVLHRVVVQWHEVAHAVESEDAVEIYNRKQYVYIPKRCIGDMDFFRSVVNEKMNRTARERNE